MAAPLAPALLALFALSVAAWHAGKALLLPSSPIQQWTFLANQCKSVIGRLIPQPWTLLFRIFCSDHRASWFTTRQWCIFFSSKFHYWCGQLKTYLQATAAAAAFTIAAAAFAGRALLKGFASIRGSLAKGVQG
jgi:hypothetical protein